MPNYCNGHYFLTVLAPVKPGGRTDRADNFSYRQRLLEVLARLPNSEVTVSSRDTGGPGQGSPFARCGFVHMARFVVIDGPAFNGRISGDTLLGRLRGEDPRVAQEADRLGTPYLLFAAELDVADGSEAAFALRIRQLWEAMEHELRAIFRHCLGFEQVDSARAFYDYLRRCQIETTMPFNDYWPEDAALPEDMPLRQERLLAGAVALGGVAALWLLCLLLAAVLPDGPVREAAVSASRWGLLVMPLLLGGAGLYLYLLYRRIMARGQQPLPPGANLPQVLKALYLQHHVTGFIAETQGRTPAELHRAFGEFLAAHKPDDLSGPTQPRGVIRLDQGAAA